MLKLVGLCENHRRLKNKHDAKITNRILFLFQCLGVLLTCRGDDVQKQLRLFHFKSNAFTFLSLINFQNQVGWLNILDVISTHKGSTVMFPLVPPAGQRFYFLLL